MNRSVHHAQTFPSSEQVKGRMTPLAFLYHWGAIPEEIRHLLVPNITKCHMPFKGVIMGAIVLNFAA